MKLVTIAVDREIHALVVSLLVFEKTFENVLQLCLKLKQFLFQSQYKSNRADSYTNINIQKTYIAAGDDYYIQLCMTELIMCKSMRYTYYCEELFAVKH